MIRHTVLNHTAREKFLEKRTATPRPGCVVPRHYPESTGNDACSREVNAQNGSWLLWSRHLGCACVSSVDRMSYPPAIEDEETASFEHRFRQLGRSGDAARPDVAERSPDLYRRNGPDSPVFACAARDGCGRHGNKR
jgi:hypothetical protein